MNLRGADHRHLNLAPDSAIMTIVSGLRLHKHAYKILYWLLVFYRRSWLHDIIAMPHTGTLSLGFML